MPEPPELNAKSHTLRWTAGPTDLLAGHYVGRYRLIKPLGAGAFGAVYAAADDLSGALVALKVLSLAMPGAAGDEAVARFQSGAAAARQLAHANIARVLDHGQTDGVVWLVMELLTGCELGRYVHPARLLPEPCVLHIVAALARALDHAHEQGVLHRDVKPANVIVDLPNDSVKLTDFGLARLVDGQRTRTGLVLGSPAYMAPEQLSGAEPSASGDLYAVGVVMFQLLTGRLPHNHESLGELLRQVAMEPAPPLHRFRPDLPAQWSATVAKALDKDADRRYASGAELALAVDELRQHL